MNILIFSLIILFYILPGIINYNMVNRLYSTRWSTLSPEVYDLIMYVSDILITIIPVTNIIASLYNLRYFIDGENFCKKFFRIK